MKWKPLVNAPWGIRSVLVRATGRECEFQTEKGLRYLRRIQQDGKHKWFASAELPLKSGIDLCCNRMKRAVVGELIDYYRKAPYLKKGEGKRRRIHYCPFCGEKVRRGYTMRIELAGLASQKK